MLFYIFFYKIPKKMVNTFITHKDYVTSARFLDRKRLFKQCLEAHQILSILQYVNTISRIYSLGYVTQVTEAERNLSPSVRADMFIHRVNVFKHLVEEYLKLSERLCRVDGELYKYKTKMVPYKLQRNEYYNTHKNIIIAFVRESSRKKIPQRIISRKVSRKISEDLSRKFPQKRSILFPVIFRRREILLDSDYAITLGFSRHPAVIMWLGYTASLKMYITSHISIFKSTPKNNGELSDTLLKTYTSTTFIHPWWIMECEYVILSHRASLLRKNREWYHSKDTTIPKEWNERGYVWPNHISREDIILILGNHPVPDEGKLCDKIS